MNAVYAGSFDPWTNGHKSIIKKSYKLFDQIHIVIGQNINKKRNFDIFKMKDAIEQDLLAENIYNCKAIIYDGLMALYCKENNISYMIRGLRNNMDYNYEENIAEVNNLLNSNLETIYIRADNAAISSSMIRELIFHKQNISNFVPPSVLNIL